MSTKNEKANQADKKKRPKKANAPAGDNSQNTKETQASETLVVSEEEFIKMVEEIAKNATSATPTSFNVTVSEFEYRRCQDMYSRRLYLYGEIVPPDNYSDLACGMTAANIVEAIMQYNREDLDVPVDKREPVIIYINSPGGSVADGFAIISAIETSKTPIYTVNVGAWYSMAFLIGIAGHKRFSLPNMAFLLHDGATIVAGSTKKVQDRTFFDERYEREVVRPHVLKHTNISEKKYKQKARDEFYMLTEDALKYGVIDEIVTDIDRIL